MADIIIDEVRPGEIITAELFNKLRAKFAEIDAKLQQLSGNVGIGTITVPSVFGTTLNTAKSIITSPTLQLSVGSIIDAFGILVDPIQPGAAGRTVIGQFPSAGTKVVPGSSINLVVAASATGGQPPTSQQPLIDHFEPNPVPAGTQVTIFGQSFGAGSNNTVTFDGKPGVVAGNSDPSKLFVTVPTTITGLPKLVTVVVETGGLQTSAQCTVLEPPAIPAPAITKFTPPAPQGGVVGNNVTITGTGFSPTLQGNRVTFDGQVADLVSITPISGGQAELVVKVPTGIEGLDQLGVPKVDVKVVVTVEERSSIPALYTVTTFTL